MLIEKALARHGGNVSQAAEALGLSRERALPPAAAAMGSETDRDSGRRLGSTRSQRSRRVESRVRCCSPAAGCRRSSSRSISLWTRRYSVEGALDAQRRSSSSSGSVRRRSRGERVVRPLQTLVQPARALREGDYSMRGARRATGRRARPGHARDQRARRHAARQRLRRVEATALLRTVMDEIDVAVFAFDADATAAAGEPRRRAAARRSRASALLGRTRRALGLATTCRATRRAARSDVRAGRGRRWEVRRAHVPPATAGRISCWSSPT